MIPIEAACASLNIGSIAATANVAKIPTCAAAPRSKLFGFARSGPKSVIAPTPIKIKHG